MYRRMVKGASVASGNRVRPAWWRWLPVVGTGVVTGVSTYFSGLSPGLSAVLAGVATVLAIVVPTFWERGAARSADRVKHDLLRLVGPAAQAPRVAEIDDPTLIGVHPAEPLAEGEATRAPVYVPRDADEQVRGCLARHQFLLLMGDSLAGKSRIAYEAIRAVLPRHRLLVPESKAALRTLITDDLVPQSSVVWLDDLELYLGAGGLTTAMVGRLRAIRGVVLVATMRTSEYVRYGPRRHGESHETPKDHVWVRDAGLVLRQLRPISIDRRFTPGELARARQCSIRDPRLAAAVAGAHDRDVTAYLAAGPQLLAEWHAAWEIGAHPAGAAIVAAAVDCRRAGFVGPLGADLLAELHIRYLTERAGTASRGSASFEEELAWAAAPIYATNGLVREVDGGYEPFDFLVDVMQRDERQPAVPKEVFEALMRYASDEDATRVGEAAWDAGYEDVAERWFQRGAEAGSEDSMGHLATIRFSRGAWEEVEDWCRRTLAASDRWLFVTVLAGTAAYQRGDLAAAEGWLLRGAQGGVAKAAALLAGLKAGQGHLDEAEDWYRQAAASGDAEEKCSLAHFLYKHRGKLAEAEIWWRRAAEAGDADANTSLGRLSMKRGDLASAERWFHAAVEAGDLGGAIEVADLYAKRQDWAAAERWYRRAADDGRPAAMFNLGVMLYEQRGELAEAERCFRVAAEAGHEGAMGNLGILLYEGGNLPEGEHWLQRAAESGTAHAVRNLAAFYEEQGDQQRSQIWYTRAAEAGETAAMIRLAGIHEKNGEIDKTMLWLQRAADAGDTEAMASLCFAYAKTGDLEQAARWAPLAAEAGHTRAMLVLASLLCGSDPRQALRWIRKAAKLGDPLAMWNLARSTRRPAEAERLLERAAAAGRIEAIQDLAALRLRQGRVAEAEDLLRHAAKE